jgi:uncharacterized protein (UPF0548 family)
MRELDEHHVYHVAENGDVGVWITDIRTTVGRGKQLFGESAEACLHWCKEEEMLRAQRSGEPPQTWQQRINEQQLNPGRRR